MPNYNISDIINELNTICTAHTSLGADVFFRSEEELTAKLRSTSGFLMILDAIKSRMTGQNNAATFKQWTIGFTILRATQLNKFEAEQETLMYAEEICDDIVKRIRYNSRALNDDSYIFAQFDFNSVEYKPTYMQKDNRMGLSVTFSFRDHIDLSFNELDPDDIWNDIP